jgi:endonuclease/exonuclease/phosphatase family metal-dependent hydrolase
MSGISAPMAAPKAAPKLWTILAVVIFMGMVGTAQAGTGGESVRILTYNTHLLTPVMMCGGLNVECGVNEYGKYTKEHAEAIAALLEKGTFDVVALNEVWDEDDGKDVLADSLDGVYPHYVKYVDVFGGGIEEDSGLMLFSKYSFEPLPDPTFVSEDNETSYGTDSDRIAYVKFDDCASSDCFSAKGAILVRLKNPGSGRIVNLVVTHPQADYADSANSSVRSKQLRQILGQCETGIAQPPDKPDLLHKTLRPSLVAGESLCGWTNRQWLLMAGDLNIMGQGAVGEALHPAQAPDKGPAEWWSKIGQKASAEPTTGYALYDPWAETSSETDKGLTQGSERLDYVLTARTTKTVPGAVALPGVCVQHVWIPPEFEGLSDHRPVAADLNLESAQCNPRLARALKPEEMGTVGPVDQGKTALKLPGELKYPGSMQWWRIDEPGTYTVAFSPQAVAQGVTFEAYEAEDLSSPLGGGYELGPDTMLACTNYAARSKTFRGCETVTGQQVVLPKAPIYLRVYNPNRAWSGPYWVAIHRHTCRSKEDNCYLLPNNPTAFDFPAAGTYLNDQDTAWFRLDVTQQADTGKPQSLRFYVENRLAGNWTQPKLALRDGTGANAVSQIGGHALVGPTPSTDAAGVRSIDLQGQTAANANYYLLVKRANVNRPLKVRAGWQTNLMLLGGSNVGPLAARLNCEDETNPEGGADEIRLEVNVDNTGWQTRGSSDYECDDSQDPRNWDSGLGLIRYLDSVQFRLIEVDENAANDESETWPVGAWDLKTAVEGGAEAAHGFVFAGGEYTLYCNLGKWLAQ